MIQEAPPSYSKPVSTDMESRWAEAILTIHNTACVELGYRQEAPRYDFGHRSTHVTAVAFPEKNTISINRILAELNDTDEFINYSVANEIAHFVNHELNGESESMNKWREIVRSLGEEPNSASYPVEELSGRSMGIMPFVLIRQ